MGVRVRFRVRCCAVLSGLAAVLRERAVHAWMHLDVVEQRARSDKSTVRRAAFALLLRSAESDFGNSGVHL